MYPSPHGIDRIELRPFTDGKAANSPRWGQRMRTKTLPYTPTVGLMKFVQVREARGGWFKERFGQKALETGTKRFFTIDENVVECAVRK